MRIELAPVFILGGQHAPGVVQLLLGMPSVEICKWYLPTLRLSRMLLDRYQNMPKVKRSKKKLSFVSFDNFVGTLMLCQADGRPTICLCTSVSNSIEENT